MCNNEIKESLLKEIPTLPMTESARESWNHLSYTRFINTYFQIEDCLRYQPRKVLIIGVGTNLEKIILTYKFGIQTDTLDIDPTFHPDIVGSVHEMPSIQDQSYDVVIVSHVLEHLDFRLFEPSLNEIARIGKHALIFLPFRCVTTPQISIKSKYLDFLLRLGRPPLRTNIDGTQRELCEGEHYWEMNFRNFKPAKISSIIGKYFSIDKEYHCPEWRYSYNFCCTSRQRQIA